MSREEPPGWLPAWCEEQFGAEPVDVLFHLQQTSAVFGLRLADGLEIVVKAREASGSELSCVAAQKALAAQGFPCARPLTQVVVHDSLAIHAEEFRGGGEMLLGDSPEIAADYAQVFALVMSGLAEVDVAPPLVNPRWVRWDHTDSGVWPAMEALDGRDQSVVPEFLLRTASRVRSRLLAVELPRVLGHADFEAQNLRWHGRNIWAVHDWDSLAWHAEAALVGAASGSFASSAQPTLAPIASSEAFLATYQEVRGRRFSVEEHEVAWAASLWLPAHNARWEVLYGQPPVSLGALEEQAAERLSRANA